MCRDKSTNVGKEAHIYDFNNKIWLDGRRQWWMDPVLGPGQLQIFRNTTSDGSVFFDGVDMQTGGNRWYRSGTARSA